MSMLLLKLVCFAKSLKNKYYADNLCTSILKPGKDDPVSVQLYDLIFEITTQGIMKHKYVFIYLRNYILKSLI